MDEQESGNLPLKNEQIINAIEQGGYPLEVQLRQKFREGGMHPVMGSWMPTARGSSDYREIDLMVQINASRIATTESLHVGVYFFVEAKNLGQPSCLVGIADSVGAESGIAHNLAEQFAGVFSQNSLLKSRPRLAKCLEPLVSGPQCVHWTMIRKEGKKGKAEMDNRYAESMRTVVKATYWHAFDWTEFLKGQPFHGDLRLFLPAVIVDTQALYTFDPTSRTLLPVEHFQLLQSWDVGGKIHWTCMTVLRAEAVGVFIDRAMQTKNLLEKEVELNFSPIWCELKADRQTLGDDVVASQGENIL